MAVFHAVKCCCGAVKESSVRAASQTLKFFLLLLLPLSTVDFLAKYCIFSQEKLAEYKRAFEAVSEKTFRLRNSHVARCTLCSKEGDSYSAATHHLKSNSSLV